MIAEALKDDHRKINEAISQLLVSLRSGNSPYQDILNLREVLKQHIYIDETHLFRLAENPQNRTRIRGLEIEHAGMLQLVDKIDEYLRRGDRARAMDRAEGLARVVEAHNDTEDRNVYAALDALEFDLDKVRAEMENVLVPPDWKCRFLQR